MLYNYVTDYVTFYLSGRMMSLTNLPCLTLGPQAAAPDSVRPQKTTPVIAGKREEKSETVDKTHKIEIPKNAERHTTKENIQKFFGGQALKPTRESKPITISDMNLEPASISSSPRTKDTSSGNIIQPAQAAESVQPSSSSGAKAPPKVVEQVKKDWVGRSVMVRSMLAKARLKILGSPARRISSKRALKACDLKGATKVTEDPKEKVVPHPKEEVVPQLPWPVVPTCTTSMPSSVSFEEASLLQLQCEFTQPVNS